MLRTFPSRSGSLSASRNGRRIHSSVDPAREARRFVHSELPRLPRTVILIGPGLGYLAAVIEELDSRCRVISLFLSDETHSHAVARGSSSWHPGTNLEPAAFISGALDELETSSVAVLEWPPGVAVFPDVAASVRDAVGSVLRQHQASLLTEGANGRRWFANQVRNFLSIDRPAAPVPSDRQTVAGCVIAAAGPSLEKSLETIATVRDRIQLWVLGSALQAVLASGLQPDLLITTDAAFHAAEYLRSAPGEIPVAAPLSAHRGFGENAPVWVLNQGDAIESLLFADQSPAPVRVPAHGTVTGTALQLARNLQQWPIIVAGMDLAWHGLRSHARPHVAYVYRCVSENRTRPLLTDLYGAISEMSDLGSEWRTNRSLQVYSEWFAREFGRYDGSVLRIGESPAVDLPRATPQTLNGLPTRYPAPQFRPVRWPDASQRIRQVSRALEACLTALESIPPEDSCHDLSSLQLFLLRRLSLDRLIRWHRERDPRALQEAASFARDVIVDLRGLLP